MNYSPYWNFPGFSHTIFSSTCPQSASIFPISLAVFSFRTAMSILLAFLRFSHFRISRIRSAAPLLPWRPMRAQGGQGTPMPPAFQAGEPSPGSCMGRQAYAWFPYPPRAAHDFAQMCLICANLGVASRPDKPLLPCAWSLQSARPKIMAFFAK